MIVLVVTISGDHLQLVTVCHQFTILNAKPTLELVPVFASGQVIGLQRQYLHHVDDQKPPDFSRLVIYSTDCLTVKFSGQDFHLRCLSKCLFSASSCQVYAGCGLD